MNEVIKQAYSYWYLYSIDIYYYMIFFLGGKSEEFVGIGLLVLTLNTVERKT